MAADGNSTGPDLRTEGIAAEGVGGDVPVPAQVDGKAVVVVRVGDAVRVVGGSCTHYGGPLAQGLCADGQIHCPWHHAAFDLETGAAAAPALDPIPAFEVEIRDGRIYVTGERHPTDPEPPASVPDSVVIVGSGAAGAAAAETLRRRGYSGQVTLIGTEAPVDRPNLSKDYLAGTAPEEWLPLRTPEFYASKEIDLRSERVVSIDPDRRLVELDGSGSLSYGALLMATGAEPRRLPIPGADLPHVHYLRTLADSRAIIAALDQVQRAVVVGAGFIGLEVAASLRARDIEVAVVAPEEIPLAHAVGKRLGGHVLGLHEQHGVGFHLGTGVDEIGSGEVGLSDGSSVPAELVVVGVGVRPRTELAEAAGLEVDDGVVVDSRLRTSDPRIWAAGDIARYPGPDGEPTRIEHWFVAERHGQAAAASMLGDDMAFTQPPFFWSRHYDVRINLTGHLAGWDEEVVVGDLAANDALVAFKRNSEIRAVATIGRDRESLRAEHALGIGNQAVLQDLISG